ncbi:MAG TPA: hypothetical protein VNH80_04930 [Burkholderiales bacterium]|nr:hypothetical protein [Burkholderiales bacterium]
MKWKPDTLSYTAIAEPRHDGLTFEEGNVMDALTSAVEYFDKLDEQHPNDTHEFYTAIHVAQDLLAVRIARRLYPEGWPTHAG